MTVHREREREREIGYVPIRITCAAATAVSAKLLFIVFNVLLAFVVVNPPNEFQPNDVGMFYFFSFMMNPPHEPIYIRVRACLLG